MRLNQINGAAVIPALREAAKLENQAKKLYAMYQDAVHRGNTNLQAAVDAFQQVEKELQRRTMELQKQIDGQTKEIAWRNEDIRALKIRLRDAGLPHITPSEAGA